jgi:DNA primase catalytic subunit
MHRIETGAVYAPTIRLTQKNKSDKDVIFKDVVLDVDMNDYKEIKFCGCNSICPECWVYMQCAMEILDSLLRRGFGFTSLLYVFSGHRGFHAWILDPMLSTIDPFDAIT